MKIGEQFIFQNFYQYTGFMIRSAMENIVNLLLSWSLLCEEAYLYIIDRTMYSNVCEHSLTASVTWKSKILVKENMGCTFDVVNM